MKDRAIEIVAEAPPSVDGMNILREYVQSRVLGALQEIGAFVPLAFMGGTALRFIYRIPRFSEDLDFTLERGADSFPFGRTVERVASVLELEGYDVTLKTNDSTAAAKAMIGFVGLTADAGLSPHPEQVLRVKVEVDTHPPAGAGLAVTLINRFGPLRIQHHDLPSLFSGKLAAVLARGFTKGRDLYDLVWYLSRSDPIEPNLTLLRNAVAQTAPDLLPAVDEGWKSALIGRLDQIDWDEARRDVSPFLEQRRDIELIKHEAVIELLG